MTTVGKCPICKRPEEFLRLFNYSFAKFNTCEDCSKSIVKAMDFSDGDRKFTDLLYSFSSTLQWIEDYKDDKKMVSAFLERKRILSEDLWIMLNNKV